MRKLNVMLIKFTIMLFITVFMILGFAPVIYGEQWTCFYQEQGEYCQSLYDESFTKLLDGSIASIDFVTEEFKDALTVEKLCKAVKADGYNISVKAPENTLAWLNEILEIPDFFDKILEKKEIVYYTPEMKKFVHITNPYRSKKIESLSDEEKNNIKRLNRLTIEGLYSQESPKAQYVIAVRTKVFCSDDEKKDYLERRGKAKLSTKGYENLKYSIFELDIDCLKKQYRVQGQFDYDDKDVKLEGAAYPFSDWMQIYSSTETIFQRECKPGNSLKK